VLFEIVKEYNNRFYYQSISKVVDQSQFKITVEKAKEEMVGCAQVTLPNNEIINYEIKYNRIVNLCGGYTLLVPGV
jgi:hypothetical protein